MKTIKNFSGTQIDVVESTDPKDEYATKEIMLEYFKERFKENGFKKVRQTWYKDDGTLIYMFNVQNSQFSKESFFFNIGLIFSEKGLKLSDYYWDCSARMLYGKNMADTFDNIMNFFEKHNTIKKIKKAVKIKDASATAPDWNLDYINTL